MNIGKKILSAFVEVTQEAKPVTEIRNTSTATPVKSQPNADIGKFRQYFDKLFVEANISGPDYYEFSKMTEAMISIQDEKARYTAVFAGLNVQGLNKQRLLSTAAEYLQLLETDAANFNSTIDAALQENVHAKQQEAEEKNRHIQQLSQEIAELHSKIAVLNNEIRENEEKLENSTGGYKTELEKMKSRILLDIEKIKQYIT